jgi:hypothetical protein
MNHFFEKSATQQGHWASGASPNAWGKTFETSVESEEFYDTSEKVYH